MSNRSPIAAPFAPTFIVGCPRSGTTLLAACIDRHSQFAVTPETHYFPLTYRHATWARKGSAILAAAEENGRLADAEMNLPSLRERFLTGPATHARLLQLILEDYAAARQKPRPAEKTPDHLRFVRLILRWYPNARVVCIQRDGRDVALSLTRMKWASDDLTFNARRWCADTEMAMRFRKQFPDRFHWLRFEDLVRDPTTSLTAVMRFLGCEFEPRQIDEQQPTAVVPAWELAWKGMASQAPAQDKLQAWRATATPEEIRVMHSEMGYHLARCGYSDAPARAGWAEWLPLLAPRVRRFADKASRSLTRRLKWVASRG